MSVSARRIHLLYVPLLGVLLLAPSARAQAPLGASQQQEMTAAHNRWRQAVGVGPLQWDAALAASARNWADRLQGEGCVPRHSSGGKVGENLFWASARRWSDGRREVQALTPDQVVDAWGSEREHYDPRSNRCQAGKVCGHYTQVTWRATTRVGCGRAVCPDASQIWVCQYLPPGNHVGQRPY